MPGKDDDFGSKGEMGFEDDGATVQMDPAEVAELHRRLAQIDDDPAAARPPQPGTLQAPPRSAPAPQPAPTPQPPAPQPPAPQPAPVAPAAAPAPAPAPAPAAAPAPAPSGSGLFIAGGVGAFLITLVMLVGLPPIAMELPREPMVPYVIMGMTILGYGLFAVALSAASRLTNAAAGVAAIFVYLTVIGSIVQLAVMPELRGDTRQIVQIVILGVEWVAWLMVGVWGLTATRSLGGLGLTAGLFGLIGGLAGVILIAVGLASGGSAMGVIVVTRYVSLIGAALASLFFGIRLMGGIPR